MDFAISGGSDFDLGAGLSPSVVSFRFPAITALLLSHGPYEKPYLVTGTGLFHEIAQQAIKCW
jgi:hypothetical protein